LEKKLYSIYDMIVWKTKSERKLRGRVYRSNFDERHAFDVDPSSVTLSHEYDYIVVGAGTAGCVIASRLADLNGDTRVLLVECGALPDFAACSSPFDGCRQKFKDSELWNFRCAQRSLGLHRDDIHSVRVARSLGGIAASRCHSIYQVPPESYFDEQLGGAWRWRDVSAYFERVERCAMSRAMPERGAHGCIGVGYARDGERRGDAISGNFASAACAVFDADVCADFNDNGVAARVGVLQVAVRDGARSHAARDYLGRPRSRADAAARRRRLTVVCETDVSQVLVRGDTCVGVALRRGANERLRALGAQCIVGARRQVVLCAGAMGSPRVLLASGINGAGGVGDMLADHICVPLVFQWRALAGDDERPHRFGSLAWRLVERLRYASTRRGVYTVAGAELAVRAPPIEIRLMLSAPDARLVDAMQLPAWLKHGRRSGDAITMLVVLVEPASRGTIECPNWLGDERDVDALADGVRMARAIAAHNDRWQQRIGDEWRRDDNDDDDDDDVRSYIRRNATPLRHLTGTCAIGRVVDEQLRVHGTRHLRVADASVLPAPPPCGPLATVLMLAERCADHIEHEHRRNAAATHIRITLAKL
jgi:choline dehydrogenase-like flavoprotein